MADELTGLSRRLRKRVALAKDDAAVRRAQNAQPGTSRGMFGDPKAVEAMLALVGSDKKIVLPPLAKRHVLPAMPFLPGGVRVGWAQLPRQAGAGFSLGLFASPREFVPIAVADGAGRVFAGFDPAMDTQSREPQFMFVKEREVSVAEGARLAPAGRSAPMRMVRAIQGNIIGAGPDGRMLWLASWLKRNNRYALEQLRVDLPPALLKGLEYRDAITIAYFAAYIAPQALGLLGGFGAGNIFRRLNREAPLGAIRRSVHDTREARSHGLRVSGLEEFFASLAEESGALGQVPGLEAVHGLEPLRLERSATSGTFGFAWQTSLPFDAALTSLKIEGALNRFAAASNWLERNAAAGRLPIEDTASRADVAMIDQALLANPALLAFDFPASAGPDDLVRDDAFLAVNAFVELAADVAAELAARLPAPGGGGAATPRDAGGSEWVYRQAMSALLRKMALPFRFDSEFRADLASGRVGVAFTLAGPAVMPASAYDETRHEWAVLDDHRRAMASVVYNMRVSLMMAALAFGADAGVQEVSVQIDSLGLEEAIAQQDDAIRAAVGDAVSSFEGLSLGDMEYDGVQGQSRPGPAVPPAGTPGEAAAGADAADAGAADVGDVGDVGVDAAKLRLDDEFTRLMSGADIDETVFSDEAFAALGEPGDAPDGAGAQGGAAKGADPLEALGEPPTMKPALSVTFTRAAFLERLEQDGLAHPMDTYRMFGAVMDIDPAIGFKPIVPSADLHGERFAPQGAQDAPEADERPVDAQVRETLRVRGPWDLSIQRDDLLAHANELMRALAADDAMPSAAKAQRAMEAIERINDPELNAMAPALTAALIDGEPPAPIEPAAARELEEVRNRARGLLFSGDLDAVFEPIAEQVASLDAMFRGSGVPRYFNSYAERAVYNHLFATPNESTVLIPDNLFYAHMELADAYAQLKGPDAALEHLNMMVSYAPAYAFAHLKLASALAAGEDWESTKAACLNALRVSLDGGDAAAAYHRYAQAAWMRDEFDVAVACTIMCSYVGPGIVEEAGEELEELTRRAARQCIAVPQTLPQAVVTLQAHGIPVWPSPDIAALMREGARMLVDAGMFVPARTLSVAAARMNAASPNAIDAVQVQFLRSLSK